MKSRVLAALVGAFLTASAYGGPLPVSRTVDAQTVVYLTQVIQPGAMDMSDERFFLLADSEAPEINIIIDSPGGDNFIMWAVIEVIDTYKGNGGVVNCYITNLAASAAAEIFLGCTNRYATKNAKFMIHDPAVYDVAFAKITTAIAKKIYEDLVKETKRFRDRNYEILGLENKSAIDQLMDEEMFVTAEQFNEAVKDEVITVLDSLVIQ